MAAALHGITHSSQCGLDPREVFKNHFVFSTNPTHGTGTFQQLPIRNWIFNYGEEVIFVPMKDFRGRLFGVFVGIGVDGDGRYIDDLSFAGFNIRGGRFWAKFEEYTGRIAGRYMIFATNGDETRCYFDPAAHMSTFYNSTLGVLASSAFLAIDREPIADPKFECANIHRGKVSEGREPNYILGHSMDCDVKFVLPNHRLELPSFEMVRIWPHESSFQDVPRDRFDNVIEEMVARQTQILNALVDNNNCVLPVTGGADSRKLLACLSGRLDDLESTFAFVHTNYARDDAATGEYAVGLVGGTLDRITIEEAGNAFSIDRDAQKKRYELFWLRSSRVAHPPTEYTKRCYRMLPKGAVHLRGNVMDLTRAVWWGRWDGRHKKMKPGLKYEIGNLFMMAEPSADVVSNWAEEYLAWKHALPANAQALVHDFIFLELFLHVSSAKYHAYADYFYINPFSDRRLIELTLSLPLEHRFGTAVNEAFLAVADPRLAGQPYRGGVRKMIEAGEWVPPSQLVAGKVSGNAA